jgi:hypothetical protein
LSQSRYHKSSSVPILKLVVHNQRWECEVVTV